VEVEGERLAQVPLMAIVDQLEVAAILGFQSLLLAVGREVPVVLLRPAAVASSHPGILFWEQAGAIAARRQRRPVEHKQRICFRFLREQGEEEEEEFRLLQWHWLGALAAQGPVLTVAAVFCPVG
jgi:hypothetical protein